MHIATHVAIYTVISIAIQGYTHVYRYIDIRVHAYAYIYIHIHTYTYTYTPIRREGHERRVIVINLLT